MAADNIVRFASLRSSPERDTSTRAAPNHRPMGIRNASQKAQSTETPKSGSSFASVNLRNPQELKEAGSPPFVSHHVIRELTHRVARLATSPRGSDNNSCAK